MNSGISLGCRRRRDRRRSTPIGIAQMPPATEGLVELNDYQPAVEFRPGADGTRLPAGGRDQSAPGRSRREPVLAAPPEPRNSRTYQPCSVVERLPPRSDML